MAMLTTLPNFETSMDLETLELINLLNLLTHDTPRYIQIARWMIYKHEIWNVGDVKDYEKLLCKDKQVRTLLNIVPLKVFVKTLSHELLFTLQSTWGCVWS